MIARALSCLSISAFTSACALAQAPNPTAATAAPNAAARVELPVREVTVFKDGHAFVLREAELGAGAEVVLEDLPAPVLGTFWPYANGGAKLVSAKAAKQRVKVERTALELKTLLTANIGKEVRIVDINNEPQQGTIVDVPRRSGEELERTAGSAPSDPALPVAGAMLLLRTDQGVKAMPLDRVRDFTVLGEPKTTEVNEEVRTRLTLRVERSAGAAGDHAKLGLVYVQKGLRWIPAYKIDVDGAGKARAELEATLVDDLVDLDDATVNLVIGVPHFEFAGMVDPIALQETAVELGRQMPRGDRMSNFLSNSIMSQSAEYNVPEPSNAPAAPEVTGAENNEDLFVFTVRHVTLKKGERLVLPIASFALEYRDVYTLDVPFAPPGDMRDSFQGDRMDELARLLSAPKAMHALRIANKSAAPLTTAPALVLANGRVISQSLMTYTPIGAESDLPMTAAVDVCVEKTESEVSRTPNAVKWGGDNYHRIDMSGGIELINKKNQAVDVEVRRSLMGLVDSADNGGTTEQKSLSEMWFSADRPVWWSWWNWPYWWQHWNGIARATWKVHLEPGAKLTLTATWHYFWR